MAANNESLLQRLASVIPIAVSKQTDLNPASKSDPDNSLSPVPGSPLDEFPAGKEDETWQQISQANPGEEKYVVARVSRANAELVVNSTNPAMEAVVGSGALKPIIHGLWREVGYNLEVYKRPLTQRKGSVSPQEVKEFFSLTKIAESGSSASKTPFVYSVEEYPFSQLPRGTQIPGLAPLHAVARKAQSLLNNESATPVVGRVWWVVVGEQNDSLPEPKPTETPVPQVFQNEFKGAPAATLDPTVKPIEAKPGEWFTLDPVKP